MMMRRSLAHHPAWNMRQRPIELMDDEHVSALETLTPNDSHGVPTPRVKRIMNPPALVLIPGSMSAEWEYAARAGSTTAYFWGDEIGEGNANCIGCGSQWDNRGTSPVGSFAPNAFGLYDMAGNVWQWVEDCYHVNYNGAPTDGSAWTAGDCNRRVVRGGSWGNYPRCLRSANRDRYAAGSWYDGIGFRLGRTLSARADVITVASGAR